MKLSSATPQDMITKILAASKLEDLVIYKTLDGLKLYKREVFKMIHPDVCDIPEAKDAVQHLSAMIDYRLKGAEYQDEVGIYKFNGWELNYSLVGVNEGDVKLALDTHKVSYDNWSSITLKGPANLLKYIPLNVNYLDSADYMGMKIVLPHRGVSLHNLELPQVHVNWVLSRLLEFSLMLNDIGWTHAGISPENVFIDPETHGIFVTSFYHSGLVGKKLKTINAGYKNWYPSEVFKDKLATALIDIELSKRLACKLLGDPSGTGVRLKKTANPAFMDFVLARHSNPLEAYTTYREMLSKNFEKKFHILKM